jgi:hypothetical protein
MTEREKRLSEVLAEFVRLYDTNLMLIYDDDAWRVSTGLRMAVRAAREVLSEEEKNG